MTFRRKKIFTLMLLFMILFLSAALFLVAELIQRKSTSFITTTPRLTVNQVNQDYNLGCIWNPRFLRKNKNEFPGWQKNLDTLTINSDHPIYVFKPFLRFKWDDQGMNALSFAGEGDSVVFSTNSFGFRGADLKKEKEKNEYRIICLGASTTEGTQLFDTQTYPYLLEQRLQSIYPELKITVVNAGHGGTKIEDQLAIMEMKGYQLQPDLVIYYGGHNNVCSKIKVKNMRCHVKRTCWEENNKRWQRFLYNRSVLFQKIINSDSFYTFKPMQYELDWEHYYGKADSFIDYLGILNDKLQQQDAELVVASIINRCGSGIKKMNYRLEQGIFMELKHYYPITIDEIAGVYKDFNNKLENFCKQNNVAYAEVAKEYPMQHENFMGDLIHFSEKGNKKIVERMLPYISTKIDSYIFTKKQR